jgi:hypothetical protein
MKILFLISLFAVISCQPAPTLKKSVDSILIEWVDTETNGKVAGGTHFSLGEGQLFLDYEYFDGPHTAESRVDELGLKAKRILEESKLTASDGGNIGKLLVLESDSKHSNLEYCLLWANRSKFTRVCSESIHAIEEFRIIYEL